MVAFSDNDPNSDDDVFFWLAINQSSAAACPMAMPLDVLASPTPETLLGFRTREQQIDVQKLLLTAPIEKVRSFMQESLPKMVQSGEVVCIKPQNPQKPSSQTIWSLGLSQNQKELLQKEHQEFLKNRHRELRNRKKRK